MKQHEESLKLPVDVTILPKWVLEPKMFILLLHRLVFFCTQIVLVMLHWRLNKPELCVLSGSQYKLLFILYLHILFKISLNILAPLKLKRY